MLFAQAFDPVRSLKASWELLKRTPGTVFLGVLLPLAVQYAVSFGAQFLMLPLMLAMQRPDWKPEFAFLAAVGAVGLVLTIAQLVFQSWIDIGFARAIRAALATGTEQTQAIFGGKDRLGTLLLARLLIGLVILLVYGILAGALVVLGVLFSTSTMNGIAFVALLGVMLAVSVAMIYVFLGMQFVTPIVAFERCSATEAIRRSWGMASGKRWLLILFWLFLCLISLAGMLACLVGLLVAVPLIETMRIEAYVAHRYPKSVAPPETAVWGSEPPPLPPQA